MGRAALILGAVVWGVAALAAIAVSLAGVERLLAALPPLAIDTEALRGALVAISAALALGAAVHVSVLLALRLRVRAARSAAVLLSSTALAVFVALAGAAFTSAAAEPSLGVPLVAAGIGSVLVAAFYAVAAIDFVREIRARGTS